MTQVIIYKNDLGGISVIYPTLEVLANFGIHSVAVKDVPFGKPFKIIESSELPDRSQRNQWDIDEVDLTDGVGGELNEFN
jgi:hypothetical protein